MDHLFVVAQPTVASVGVARRILETADDVELEVGKTHLVVNNVRGDESWDRLVGEGDLPVEGMLFRVPHDEDLREAAVTGECVGFAGPAAEALEAALKNALGP